VIEAVLIGLAAGLVAGLLGVGGGALFVPALTIFLGLSLVEAEATSLLAIVPVALVGAWRQRAYGHVNMGDAVAIGLLAVAGAVAGVVVANAVSERVLEIAFAALLLLIAGQLVRRALRPGAPEPAAAPPP
jgi:uncharacterized membrane protein YfcA